MARELRCDRYASSNRHPMIQIHLQRHDPQALLESMGGEASAPSFRPFGEDGLTFGDLLDVINPLQHIPFLGGLYRKLTGDTIDPAMRVAGGALFGGPIGAALSAAAVAVNAARSAVLSPDADALPTAAVAAVDEAPADAVARLEPTLVPVRTLGAPGPEPREDKRNVSESRPEPPRSPAPRPIRRGGWMIVHAYGETELHGFDDARDKRAAMLDIEV